MPVTMQGHDYTTNKNENANIKTIENGKYDLLAGFCICKPDQLW